MTKLFALIGLTFCSLTANAAVIEAVGKDTIKIHGVIDSQDPQDLQDALLALAVANDNTVPPRIIIDIDSNGGCAVSGITMHDQRKRIAALGITKITCMVREDCVAASAAAIIWNGGNEQVLLKGARVLYHLPYRASAPGPDKVIDALDNRYIEAIRHSVPFDVATLCVMASMDEGSHVYYGVCHTKTRGIKGCRLDANTLEFVEQELPSK